jgi:hypothetical protein
MEFAERFGNKELKKRVEILMRTYNITINNFLT